MSAVKKAKQKMNWKSVFSLTMSVISLVWLIVFFVLTFFDYPIAPSYAPLYSKANSALEYELVGKLLMGLLLIIIIAMLVSEILGIVYSTSSSDSARYIMASISLSFVVVWFAAMLVLYMIPIEGWTAGLWIIPFIIFTILGILDIVSCSLNIKPVKKGN